jgi:hypothetical protein
MTSGVVRSLEKYISRVLLFRVRKSVNEYKGEECRRNNFVIAILIHLLYQSVSTGFARLSTLITYSFHKNDFFCATYLRL